MKKIRKTIINGTEKICKIILDKIEKYKEKELWRESVSELNELDCIDCSDDHALDFCIQQINTIVEKYSLKDNPGSKIVVVNGVALADFININGYKNISENDLKSIANSVLLLCQKEGSSQKAVLRINCTEEGMKSLGEFFQGKGYVNINI